MAYLYTTGKGTTSYLHRTVTKLRNGREQPIFSFGLSADNAHVPNAETAGCAMSEASSSLRALERQAAS